MKPQSNGLVELHDSKERERICFDLMGFVAEEAESLGIKYTGQHQELWDKRLSQMKARQCAYRDRCPSLPSGGMVGADGAHDVGRLLPAPEGVEDCRHIVGHPQRDRACRGAGPSGPFAGPSP